MTLNELYLSTLPKECIDLNKRPVVLLAEDKDEYTAIYNQVKKNYEKLAAYDIYIITDAEIFDLLENPNKLNKEKLNDCIARCKNSSVSVNVLPFLFLITLHYLIIRKKISIDEYNKAIYLFTLQQNRSEPLKVLLNKLNEYIDLV